MPIKINSSGVLPIIFASSVLAAPRTIVSFMKASSTTKMINTIFNYQEPVGFSLIYFNDYRIYFLLFKLTN